MLEIEDSFVKLVSKDRFPNLKDFALKVHSAFGSTCTLFSLKLVNLLFHSLNHFVGSGPKVATFGKIARRSKIVGQRWPSHWVGLSTINFGD